MDPIYRRIRWAKSRRASLERSIQQYQRAYPIGIEAEIAEDRLSWQLKAIVEKKPPLQRWGFWHADITHNIRATLDNYIWFVAHEQESLLSSSTLSFPVVSKEKEWSKNGQSKIKALPDSLQRFIKGLQPFASDEQTHESLVLYFLHKMDIQNKHHAPVVAGLWNEQLFTNSYKIDYKEDPDPAGTKTVEMYAFEFINKQPLLRELVPKPIKKISNGEFRLDVRLVLTMTGGDQIPLLGSLDSLIEFCEKVIDQMESIRLSADSHLPNDAQSRAA